MDYREARGSLRQAFIIGGDHFEIEINHAFIYLHDRGFSWLYFNTQCQRGNTTRLWFRYSEWGAAWFQCKTHYY